MTTAATISIQLEAQTALLQKGFRQAREEVKGFRQQMGRAMRVVQASHAIAVFGTIARAIRSVTRAVIEMGDAAADVGDFADRIGMDPRQLQIMQAYVEQFGGNADALGISLQRMTRRVAEAAESGGPLADMLADMGLNVEELAEQDPYELFKTLSDAIRESRTNGEALLRVFKLADTEGAQFTQSMLQGSQALEEFNKQLGDSVALTEEETRKAQELSGEMKLLNRRWDVAADRIMLAFIPAIKLAVWWFELWSNIYSWVSTKIMQLWDGIAEAIGAVDIHRQMHGGIISDKELKAMEEYRDLAKEVKALTGTPEALTSTSMAGFSAIQEWLRGEKDSTYERDMLAKMDTLIEVTADDRVDVVEYSV